MFYGYDYLDERLAWFQDSNSFYNVITEVNRGNEWEMLRVAAVRTTSKKKKYEIRNAAHAFGRPES